MRGCKHEYKSEISTHSKTGLIWVCSKCGMVKPYRRVKRNYMDTLLQKYSRNQ